MVQRLAPILCVCAVIGCGAGADRHDATSTEIAKASPAVPSADTSARATSSAPAERAPIHVVLSFEPDPSREAELRSSSGAPVGSPLDVLREPERHASSWGGARGYDGMGAITGGIDEPRVAGPSASVKPTPEMQRRREETDLQMLQRRIETDCLGGLASATGTFRLAVRVSSWGGVLEARTLENDAPTGFASCVEPLVYATDLQSVHDGTTTIVIRLQPSAGPAH